MSNSVAPIHAALMQALLLLVLLWMLPHVARQEFLFGVFVGVTRDRLRITPTIFRIWHAGMAVITVMVLASCVGLWASGWRFSAYTLPSLAVVFAGVALYYYCHGRARHYGIRSPRVAVAPVVRVPIVSEVVPLAAQITPWILVVALMAWTFLKWEQIPAMVPVAWDAAGVPIETGPRSSVQVFLGPMLAFATLLVPLHLASTMISRPLPALRDPGPPKVQRMRRIHRKAFAWYMWWLSMLMGGVVAYFQWDSIRSMTGEGHLGRGPVVAAFTVTVAALIGAILLAFRAAHGLDRMQREEVAEEMRDFLHQSRWVAGLFYFNPQDPAFLIQQRFGLGVNINFGNRRAITIGVTLLILVLSVALLPLILLLIRG